MSKRDTYSVMFLFCCIGLVGIVGGYAYGHDVGSRSYEARQNVLRELLDRPCEEITFQVNGETSEVTLLDCPLGDVDAEEAEEAEDINLDRIV